MRKYLTVLIIVLAVIGKVDAQQGEWYNDDGGYTFQGLGTISNPYEISSGSVLAYLAEKVNSSTGENYAGVYFVLTEDIDLAAHYWIPIGSDPLHPFCGIFDGNGKTIRNLNIQSTSTADYPASGLFGYVGNGAKIENLIIESGNVIGCNNQAVSRTGALAGYLYCNTTGREDSIIIRNCHNRKVTITGGKSTYSNTGGLIGEGYAFCDSDGSASILIERCSNTGDIIALPSGFPYAGGIIGKGRGHGYCDGSVSASGSFQLSFCSNRGMVIGGETTGADAVSSTGGIVGFGDASGDGYGHSDGSGIFTIEFCSNMGPVKGGDAASDNAYTYTGGLFGYGDGYGYGDVSTGSEGKRNTGNGYGSGKFSVTSSINRGSVIGGDALNTGTISSTGGLFGFASGSAAGDSEGRGYAYGSFNLRNCYSAADISARKGYIGGLGGWIATSGKGPNYIISAIMQNSYAGGTINANTTVNDIITGGIIGRVHRSGGANVNPCIDHCLVTLSHLEGNATKTFRVAGQMMNIDSPAKTLVENYAYAKDGKWVDRRSLQNGIDWTGIMTAPPISEWNNSGKAWIIKEDIYEFLPTLRYIPNQQSVQIP